MPSKIPPEERRCVAISRSTQARCIRPKVLGIDFCTTHLRNNKKANMAKHEAAKVEQEVEREIEKLTKMQRFTQLIPADDPEARGDVALVTELRRTVQRIRIFDEFIAELNDGDIGWGRTMFERNTSNESGVDGDFTVEKDTETSVRRFEARANIIYEMQMRERVHLVNISKVWIGAGFKARELELVERQTMAFNTAIMELVVALGRDPAEPEVRSIVYRVMVGLVPKENQKELA